ncbi:phosphoadenosine phosphosulfate reductase family protein [Haloarcula sp. Atlit-7R]|uniref:phosphoadenosine phosphosulfate reductase domain-containing protein n=1 Tax=Haloarcula sp. Atlit-7R TaxID=2282125 RepID=UPI000EF164DC|nr:phosphoadenosine phosphosulfate reductase family protein [Haloarcula sp. Atlit-7R]RLM94356.1 hypothetical protein D3D01_15960 [Haloarcula sp. Atlit-7R]
MISIDPYDISAPDESVRTETIQKPQPNSDPLEILESDRILDTSCVGHGKDKAVLFSGGDDSLALTHLAMEKGWADVVVHLATNSAIPENIDYVRRVAKEHCWPLIIISSPVELDTFSYRYGFPGAQEHTAAYHSFKGRQLAYLYRRRSGGVKFISGVRKLESDRRMKNISAEVQYSDATSGGNFTGWWVSPLIHKSDEWVHKYRRKHDLPRNPVAKQIHRSGDCQCLAYGNRSEELILIESEYPEFGEWLRNVEKRTQEYRGRIHILEDEFPDVASEVARLRKQTRPNPMKMTILKENFPGVYHDIISVSRDDAILRGQMEPTNYIGHGGMSSDDLQRLVASADQSQATLCETCGDGCSLSSSAVERQIERAEQAYNQTSAVQEELPGITKRDARPIETSQSESGEGDNTVQTTLL